MVGTAKQIITWLMDQDKTKKYKVTEFRQKRSLDQNGYYWALITKLASALRISKTELHNRLLRDYGHLEWIDGRVAAVYLPNDDETEQQVMRAETYHLKPTSAVAYDENGRELRKYFVLRGSSTYDSREMAILLDGAIEEAKAQGIETLPPHVLEEMRAKERKKEKRHEVRTAQP